MDKGAAVPGAPTLWRLGEGRPPSGPHVALVPGALAPVLPVDLPVTLSGAAREQVAMRQLVEQLSLPPGSFEMHPVKPKAAKTWAHVTLIEADHAAAWRAALGKGCRAVLPDFMALPAAEGLWSIAVQGDQISARLGPSDGFSAEEQLAEAQLSRAAPPKAILRLGDENQALDDLLFALDVPIVKDLKALKAEGITPLRWADSVGGLNLKAAPSAAEDRIHTVLKRWRGGVLAACIAAIAWIGVIWQETREAEARAALAERRIDALVRQHFVPSGPILDVRAQVTKAVEAALQPDVIEVQTVPALAQFQIAAELLTRDGANVQSVLYRRETGLETIIAAADFSILDEIIIALQEAEFLVEQLDSRAEQSGGVVAQLRLELF